MENYLTEESLGYFLKSNFKGEWIHDKPFLGRFRPDWRNDMLKLIVEFDGDKHYTSATRILSDEIKDKLYLKNGYATVRIPYFIQLSESTCHVLFGKNFKINQTYPHGFIDKKCVLPADFCELGTKKFLKDIERFENEKKGIIDSLINKIEKSRFGKAAVVSEQIIKILNLNA